MMRHYVFLSGPEPRLTLVLLASLCWDMQTPIMLLHVEPISVEHGQYLDNRANSTEVVDTSKRSYQPYLE